MARKKKNTGMIIGAVVIILAALITYQAYRATIEDPLQSAIAQCLTDNGVAMYGVDTCPACLQQKTVFGTSFRHIEYIECDKTPQACQQQSIQSTPTWINAEGDRLVGLRGLGELAEFGSCADVAVE